MFDPARHETLAGLVTAHSQYLTESYLFPFLSLFERHIDRWATRLAQLRASFLGREPVEPEGGDPASSFWLESQKKDKVAQLRRYTLNTQAKGLHADLRGACTEQAHLALALATPHPILAAATSLEAPWAYVFAQLEAGFKAFGVSRTFARLADYRSSVLRFFSELKVFCEPFQEKLQIYQPATCRAVSGHVNSLFFYVLLRLTNYPNPLFPFKFFSGAPVVGEFVSPALRDRRKVQGPFDDPSIQATRRQAENSLRSVKLVLAPAAAEKSMEKMDGEFASGTFRGPFDNREDLRRAIQTEIRKNPGFESFVVNFDMIIISPQFSVEELSAFNQEVLAGGSSTDLEHDFKIRNIWNAKILNVLTQSYNTYIPNNHSDVSCIVLYWVSLLARFGFSQDFLGYPADFKSAYRQMPLEPLQILFAASAYFHYDAPLFKTGCVKYGFYTSLPFGSSIAPANWGEVCVALAWIMAYILLAVITHCVDDICGIEPDRVIQSSREAFLQLVRLIGLNLDPKKSLAPSADFLYLGLRLLLPQRLPRQVFALQIPPLRRDRLVSHLESFRRKMTMTSGEASSMRGRLYFYAYWFRESRSYLSELAARQYSKSSDSALTHELVLALEYFLYTLQHDPKFLEGIQPLTLLGRTVGWLYTDGSLEHEKTVKGIGGVCFPAPPEGDGKQAPSWFGEYIDPNVSGYHHIAPIEMFAIFRALTLFGHLLRGKAIWLFCDNTHAVGCLLRRSSMVPEETRKRPVESRAHTPEEHFYALPANLRRGMNELARLIWQKVSELDILLWIEYVWTKVNLADAPSRGEQPIVAGTRLGRTDLSCAFQKCRCPACEG